MRQRRKGLTDEERARLEGRLQDLELRVKMLEARMRGAFAQARRLDPGDARVLKSLKARRGRARPRCPGCTLELPAGRKGPTCVWCGFQFAAVGGKLR